MGIPVRTDWQPNRFVELLAITSRLPVRGYLIALMWWVKLFARGWPLREN
jgi:hypothetical protein